MDRRQFLQRGVAASAFAALVARVSAQAPAPPSGPFVLAPITRRLTLDAHSRSLQWNRSADDVAKAAIEMVCGGVCVTVGSYPAHVDATRVRQDLPAFAKQIRAQRLRVAQIQGPPIQDVTEPNAEAIITAAADAGCSHYSLGRFTYDVAKPLAPQLDAIKSRLERVVRLNQKYKLTLVYETVPGRNSVGGNVLDLLPLMKEFDPRYIGFGWDTGHMALHADGMWETLMRLAGPYIATVSWRDRGWVQDLGLQGEGGPYAGPYPRVEPLVTLADGSAVPGTPQAAGRGRGGAGRGGGRGGGGGDEGDAPSPATRGGGPPRGPANSAGAGSIDASNPLWHSVEGEMPKRPIGGENAKGAGWTAPNVAMGTGLVHIPRVALVLAEIGFNGPTVLRSEYAGIGGAEHGADKITRDRQFVIGRLKRDVITIRKSFEMANVGVAI
jgi:sugar phosphate isomerase/epimerase